MRNLPPLVELRAFEAAGRHMSFKAAATELGVTPTAISHQIKLLEVFCGHALFHRQPRPISLTEVGAHLFPVIRDGLDAFAAVLSDIQLDSELQPLVISTTSAFASRWLVPRLAQLQAVHPNIRLEVIGTDAMLDIRAGECDLAIRYIKSAPPDLVSHELIRDRFVAVCIPELLPGGKAIGNLADLGQYTLIHWNWSPLEMHPPTWRWWLELARSKDSAVPTIDEFKQLTLKEELHAIDAVLAGQGIALFSDLIVAHELETGALVKVVDLSLPGLGYYLVYLSDHARNTMLGDFAEWAVSVS